MYIYICIIQFEYHLIPPSCRATHLGQMPQMFFSEFLVHSQSLRPFLLQRPCHLVAGLLTLQVGTVLPWHDISWEAIHDGISWDFRGLHADVDGI